MRKSDNKTTKNSAKSGSNRTEKNCKYFVRLRRIGQFYRRPEGFVFHDSHAGRRRLVTKEKKEYPTGYSSFLFQKEKKKKGSFFR